MVVRSVLILLGLFSIFAHAETSTGITTSNTSGSNKELMAKESKGQRGNGLLPDYRLSDTSPYNKKKESLVFGGDNSKKLEADTENEAVLPDLFSSTLPSTFHVQGRFIEKENMSKEGSSIEGAALNFIFVQ